MNKIATLCLLMFIWLIAPHLYADIYVWTDDNGVKHFTNQIPPKHAEIIMKTKEIPFDEEADRVRREAETQEQAERARLELIQREAELERREWEAERRLADANQRADETLKRAENVMQDAENYDYSNRRSGYSGYSGYYRNPYYNRWYYRHDGNIYYKRKKPTPHRKSHEKYAGKSSRRSYSKGDGRSINTVRGNSSRRVESRSSRSRSSGTARSRGFNSGARTRGFSGRR